MTKSQNNGVCLLCQETIEQLAVIKHIEKCLENSTSTYSEHNIKEKIFLMKIFTGKEFWLYIEINGSATLETLDYFLREIWLECCGHMSQFTINNETYSSDENMTKKVYQVFSVNTEFYYEYDFGDTTELIGFVISARPGKLQEQIRLLVQNNLPESIRCRRCKNIPQAICTDCYDFFCNKCKRTHVSCAGEEYMLPVVNSPRMGVCAYAG